MEVRPPVCHSLLGLATRRRSRNGADLHQITETTVSRGIEADQMFPDLTLRALEAQVNVTTSEARSITKALETQVSTKKTSQAHVTVDTQEGQNSNLEAQGRNLEALVAVPEALVAVLDPLVAVLEFQVSVDAKVKVTVKILTVSIHAAGSTAGLEVDGLPMKAGTLGMVETRLATPVVSPTFAHTRSSVLCDRHRPPPGCSSAVAILGMAKRGVRQLSSLSVRRSRAPPPCSPTSPLRSRFARQTARRFIFLIDRRRVVRSASSCAASIQWANLLSQSLWMQLLPTSWGKGCPSSSRRGCRRPGRCCCCEIRWIVPSRSTTWCSDAWTTS